MDEQRKDKVKSRASQIPLCGEYTSTLYYPPASLASWWIFHLILAVTIENWTCRCVLYTFAILLHYLLLYFSPNSHKQEADIHTFRVKVDKTNSI